MDGNLAVAADLLTIDPAIETARISDSVCETLAKQLNRRGVVVGVSGGIDSSVVAALCTRALGKDRVLALIMPEADSSKDSEVLGRKLAESLGIRFVVEDITGIL